MTCARRLVSMWARKIVSIERAKVLLSDRANSITDVALILGYSFTSSFTLAFHKITGQTPSEFRKNVT